MAICQKAGRAASYARGVTSTTRHVNSRDGMPLLVREWRAESGAPWATLLLVHGLAEHSGRYEHVGEHFAAAGIETRAIDLRGFGASGGPRAFLDRWAQLHDDLEEQVIALRAEATERPLVLRAEAPERPLVLYGHSLGGLVCLGYALDGRSRPDLLVLSAPAISASIPAWQRVMVGVLDRVAPRMSIPNRLSGEQLSIDAAVGIDYFADPLNVHASTARFGALAFAEQRRVSRALDRLSIPTLVIHGGDDPLVPTATSAVFEGRRGVTRRVFEGLRHETHNEPDRERVLDAVVAWIRSAV
jgi:alpha-beta hydrolase superfamily lysophospholipase